MLLLSQPLQPSQQQMQLLPSQTHPIPNSQFKITVARTVVFRIPNPKGLQHHAPPPTQLLPSQLRPLLHPIPNLQFELTVPQTVVFQIPNSKSAHLHAHQAQHRLSMHQSEQHHHQLSSTSNSSMPPPSAQSQARGLTPSITAISPRGRGSQLKLCENTSQNPSPQRRAILTKLAKINAPPKASQTQLNNKNR
jgi:hypothetical protein